MKTLRVALAQINPTVGDLKGNAAKCVRYIRAAVAKGADIVAFPELALTGYPPEDLLLKPRFIRDNLKALETVRENTEKITAVVGFVDRRDDIYNAAAVISNKKIIDVYHKHYLPNYGVFDENRYFQAGTRCPVYKIGDALVGISICEDIWYPEGPVTRQSLAGAELILNINASPYSIGKRAFRERMLRTRATDNASIVAYLNMVGGQDELVFDGGSYIISESGEMVVTGKLFDEDLIVADLDLEAVFIKRLHDPRRRQHVLKLSPDAVQLVEVPGPKSARKSKSPPPPLPALRNLEHRELESHEEIYKALTLGLRDYAGKNGFKGVVIGLSGGVDSALVATLAVDALGAENVTCLFMPTVYTSKESRDDSRRLARKLRIKLTEVPIQEIFESYLGAFKKHFRGMAPDETEENVQARIRGNMLMAFSNKMGWLVLTTGNKSEMSVGYATLYGDMAGGFAVLKDVPKTLLYELAKWRNRAIGPAIPESVLWKEPTAELRPEQLDTDTLPPYPELDPILKAYIEEDRSYEEIVSVMKCSPECTKRVIRMIEQSEYKRRQSPPGIKITQRAFGRDRRFPITNAYKGFQ